MIGNVVAYVPCAFCEKKEMCSMCELSFRRNQSEWISVDERLPESEGKYLVCTSNGNIGVGNFINYYGTGKHLCFDTWAVTHWMPLPEPPKMKGDE